MNSQQFNITAGLNGFSIISAGQSIDSNFFSIQLFGITDGSNVTLTVKSEPSFTLSKLGTKIPNGLVIYNKFTSISIDASQTNGAAICYNANTNYLD